MPVLSAQARGWDEAVGFNWISIPAVKPLPAVPGFLEIAAPRSRKSLTGTGGSKAAWRDRRVRTAHGFAAPPADQQFPQASAVRSVYRVTSRKGGLTARPIQASKSPVCFCGVGP